jgi:hypothetical protein
MESRDRLEQSVADGTISRLDRRGVLGWPVKAWPKHDVEIRHVKQFRLPVRNPLGARQALALRTIPIATRVVCDALMAAFVATFYVTAERCRAAALDSDHGTAARARL